MDALLEFIDHLCCDDRLYWRAKTPTGEIELLWNRELQPQPWRFRSLGAETWQILASRDLKAALAACGCDLKDLEKQIGVSVLTQAVFADMVLESVRKLFGEDVVQRSIADARSFLDSVASTTRELTEKTPAGNAPSLRLVD